MRGTSRLLWGVSRPVLEMALRTASFGIGLVADAFPAIRSQFEGLVSDGAGPLVARHIPVFAGEMSPMPTIARPENGIHFAGEHASS